MKASQCRKSEHQDEIQSKYQSMRRQSEGLKLNRYQASEIQNNARVSQISDEIKNQSESTSQLNQKKNSRMLNRAQRMSLKMCLKRKTCIWKVNSLPKLKRSQSQLEDLFERLQFSQGKRLKRSRRSSLKKKKMRKKMRTWMKSQKKKLLSRRNT